MSAQLTRQPTAPTGTSAEATGAAPFWRMALGQTRAELTMTLRRGESLLITLFIPVAVLIFFAALHIGGATINQLTPGVLALAVMSTGMVSLGIATAYERYYGVLKRLGASPLPRVGLILAKALSVLVVEIGQVILLTLIAAIFFGWRPNGSFLLALFVFLVGSATFAGLGMLMAGALRAEATLAGANGLYLLFLLIPGVVVPVTVLPTWLQGAAKLAPAAALADSLTGALTAQGVSAASLIALIVWGIVFLGGAAFTFKWE